MSTSAQRAERRRLAREAQKAAAAGRTIGPAPVPRKDEVRLADQLVVGAAEVLEAPALIWRFAIEGNPYPAITVPHLTDEQLDELGAMVMRAIETAKANRKPEVEGSEEAEPGTLSAVPDPPAVVECGDCGTRIFGERAEAGYCAKCQAIYEEHG